MKETLKNFSKKNKDLLKKILNICFDGNHLLIYIASDNDDFLNENNSYVNLLAEYGANVIPLIDSIYESNYFYFDDIQNKNNFIKWSCIHDNGGALRMLRKRDII